MNSDQLEKVREGKGFIAALDQSGGSTPKALKLYGVDEDEYDGGASGQNGNVPSDLARQIYEVAHLRGEFVLRSGATSSEYFDKFQFMSRPELLESVAAAMAAIVPPDVEVLAGLQLGGVPLAAALALRTRLPAVYVRLERKSYATQKIAEGVDLSGKVVAIVEDVVSTGGQIVLSTADLREEAADVRYALAVVDRGTRGGENLAAAGLTYRFLFTSRELEKAAGA